MTLSLRLGALTCALVTVVGVAHAAPDFEAVGERLAEAVLEGELSDEQAEAMMAELARHAFAERLDEARRDREGDDYEDPYAWVEEDLEELDLDEEQTELVHEVMKKVAHMARDNHGDDDFEWLPRYLKQEVGLNGEQLEGVLEVIEEVVETALEEEDEHHRRRHDEDDDDEDDDEDDDDDDEDDDDDDAWEELLERAERLGIKESVFDQIVEALKDAEVEDEALGEALDLVLKFARQAKKRDKVDVDRYVDYLEEELDLDGEQVERVIKIARKVADYVRERDGRRKPAERDDSDDAENLVDAFRELGVKRETVERVTEVLEETGLEGERLLVGLSTVQALIHSPEIGRELLAYLGDEADFTEEQVKRVARVAERLRRSLKDKPDEAREEGVEAHFMKLGISRRNFERVVESLEEAGVVEERLERTLGAMLRMVHRFKDDPKVEVHPRLREYLAQEVELTKRQLERAEGLARKLAERLRDR